MQMRRRTGDAVLAFVAGFCHHMSQRLESRSLSASQRYYCWGTDLSARLVGLPENVAHKPELQVGEVQPYAENRHIGVEEKTILRKQHGVWNFPLPSTPELRAAQAQYDAIVVSQQRQPHA